MNIKFETGCEPTEGIIGKIIRTVLSASSTLHPESLAQLFSADRNEHLYGSAGIKKKLDESGIYITDRYWFSSLAYQSLDADWRLIEEFNSRYPLPGHLIFLELPVNHAQKRLASRKNKEIFESPQQQNLIAENYIKAIDSYRNSKMKLLELDAAKASELLLKEALDFLKELWLN